MEGGAFFAAIVGALAIGFAVGCSAMVVYARGVEKAEASICTLFGVNVPRGELALQESQRSAKDLEKLARYAARVLTWMSDDSVRLTTLVRLVVECIYDLIPAQRVSLYIVDHAKRELWVALSQDVMGMRIPFGVGIVGRVAETGISLNVADCYGNGDFFPAVDDVTRFVTRSMLCMPVRNGTEVLAVIAVINKVELPAVVSAPDLEAFRDELDPVPFDTHDEGILSTFALQVGLALRKCVLQSALMKIQSDRNLDLQEGAAAAAGAVGVRPSAADVAASLADAQDSLLREFMDNSLANPALAFLRPRSDSAAAPEAKDAVGRSSGAGDGSGGDEVGGGLGCLAWPEAPDAGCADLVERWALDVHALSEGELLGCCEAILRMRTPAAAAAGSASLRRFVLEVRRNYRDENAFHNFYHAAATVHVTHKILQLAPVGDFLEPVALFGLAIGAFCHDLGHPGVNNGFLVNTADPIALQHNDDAVLERFHAAKAFEVLRTDGCEILAGVAAEDYCAMRRCIIDAILSTDMSRHFELVATLRERDPSMPWGRPEDPLYRKKNGALLVKAVVHAADLVGQALPWELSQKWSDRVLQEFRAQARMEVERGLPKTPHMHGLDSPAAVLNLQKGFVENIVLPLWSGMVRILPGVAHLEENARQNADRYGEALAAT